MKDIKHLPGLYDQISDLVEPYQAYLVGGAVRDLLLGAPAHDLDFAFPKDPLTAARSVADQLGGAFFVLDQERETARVLLKDEAGERMMVDFTLFQGASIEDDLGARDFTITSMAIMVGGEGEIIDPFHGAQDLKDGLLRATTAGSLENDPLRCLRALRLAAQFGLMILPETKAQIRKYGPKLGDISPERIRDELFRILEGPKQTAVLQSLEILGLRPHVFLDEIDDDQVSAVRFLEELWELFIQEHDQDRAANWSLALLVHRLGRFRPQLRSYLKNEPVPDRNIYQLSFIAALLMHDREGKRTEDLRKVLPLSNQEWEILVQSPGAAGRILHFSRAGENPQPIDIYRYFRQYGAAGVLGVFLALSAAYLEFKNEADQQGWITILEINRSFLEGWWEKRDQWVDPPVLLNGDDIQSEFKLSPGPRIGQLLELLREAQIERGISTRLDAIEYLGKMADPLDETAL